MNEIEAKISENLAFLFCFVLLEVMINLLPICSTVLCIHIQSVQTLQSPIRIQYQSFDQVT